MGEELKQTAGMVVGRLMQLAGDDPRLKQAGKAFSGAILTVAKAVNVALLPLAAVNFGFDKARAYFDEKFRSDLAEYTDSIPPEQVVMPKPSIAGPALQGLAFTHEECDLKKMYLQLIAASMDGRKAADVHPAFVEVIKQLTSREARLLRHILIDSGSGAIAEIIGEIKVGRQQGQAYLHRHLMDLQDDQSAEPMDAEQVSAMVDNWLRLGLVSVDYAKTLASKHAYDWVQDRPEYRSLKKDLPDGVKISIGKGLIERTSFGKRFAEAVGLTQ